MEVKQAWDRMGIWFFKNDDHQHMYNIQGIDEKTDAVPLEQRKAMTSRIVDALNAKGPTPEVFLEAVRRHAKTAIEVFEGSQNQDPKEVVEYFKALLEQELSS